MNLNDNSYRGDQQYEYLELDDVNYNQCKYFEISEFQNKFKNVYNNFSILSQNVQSLRSKWDEFRDFIYEISNVNFKFSVIGIQEIWSISPDFSTYLEGYGNLISKLRQPRNENSNKVGGGIGLWISLDYKYEELENFSIFKEGIFESLFVKIYSNKDKYRIVGNIYRPPGASIREFNEILDESTGW